MTDPLGVAVAAAKVIPWNQLGSLLKALFSPRVAILGPAAGGKSTFIDVINNEGRLVPLQLHEMTTQFKKGRATKFELSGPYGKGELVLRSIDDTPGQKGFTLDVLGYVTSYKPKLLILVVDVARPFDEAPDRAEADSGRWFSAIRLKAQDFQPEFSQFIRKLSCVIVLLNKFDKAHEILRTETQGRVDELDRRLREHEAWYAQRVRAELDEWFRLGGRQLGVGDLHFFKCCLVTYQEKTVTTYDEGHLGVFVTAAACLRRSR